jgi:pyruvate/2-oxoglutarate dehydrogenase complex dihydrolipoamide acyltransferase (E2) component
MNQPHDTPPRLVVPDLGLGAVPLSLSLWLVAEGQRVAAGDRVVELCAGAATIDLEAPCGGRIVAILRDEDDPVAPGDVLAEFEGAS